MIVRTSTKARADLRAIKTYIAQDDPRRALTFILELRHRCAALVDFPERYPLVARYEHTGVRHFVHGRYLVFYRVEVSAVTVLHILHGAQDYTGLLFPE